MNLAAVTCLLPVFEGLDREADEESVSFACDRLRNALSEIDGFIPFDWPSWCDKAFGFMLSPSLIQEADLATIFKLITFHFRQNRFVDGHLEEVVRTGLILRALRRIHEVDGASLGWRSVQVGC
ncbi:DUF6508 domain-containing protein [Roseateles sp. PN1]|uniref:DUF6508 domain-containing protein n=1 Tax=Roseateles sp. PN1 TaxID=3137372 RepID=UPI0031395DF8